MQLVSIRFALFAAILLLLYYRAPRGRQWQLLLAASMIFYMGAGLRYLVFLLFTAASSFTAALLLEKNRGKKQACRRWLAACLVTNFGMLFVCKVYLLFPHSDCFLSVGLPMGMSFYIFQSMGYCTDVSRGREAEKSFFRFLLFTSYFPQLIQGPISKYSDLQPQLMDNHSYDKKQVSFGLQRMLWGYFKKLVIADRIGPAVAALRGSEYTGFPFFLLTLFYAVQIYSDFTGGMDIALGLSQALGIKLTENFLHPFFSRSIAQYWRRWHITLGSWMREYIFYPVSISKPIRQLGKSVRKRYPKFGKRFPVYAATLVTWLATGLWHGLTPNFLLWGFLNCAVIVLSEELTPVYRKIHSHFRWKDKSWYGAFEMLRTFLMMNLIRSCDLFPNPGDYFRKLGSLVRIWDISFLLDGGILTLGLSWLDYGILIISCGLLLAVSFTQERYGSIREYLWKKTKLRWSLLFGLFLTILLMGHYGVGYSASSFIYNQF